MEKKEIKKIQENGLTKLNEESLDQVNGGKIKEKSMSQHSTVSTASRPFI